MVGTGVEAEEIGTETHVGEAAPEALEEGIMIDVQVCMVSFHFWLKSSVVTERDRRDYRYDDRRDPDRREGGDRRRNDRRDDRDRQIDDPRDGDISKRSEAKPPPGLKEDSGKHRSFTTSQCFNSA